MPLARVLVLFFMLSLVTYGESVTRGMSTEQVRIQLGQPESEMDLGNRTIWTYADGSKLEFADGKLVKENGQLLTLAVAKDKESTQPIDSLLSVDDLVEKRDDQTIGASIQKANFGENSAIGDIESDLTEEDYTSDTGYKPPKKSLLLGIIIAFCIEVIVYFIILKVAFHISGFPNVFRELVLLSITVAVIGALMHTLLRLGPIDLFRAATTFLILIILIRQLTDVGKWATAIKIALITKAVSLVALWLVLLGFSELAGRVL